MNASEDAKQVEEEPISQKTCEEQTVLHMAEGDSVALKHEEEEVAAMKLLLLFVALVAVAFCQDCSLERSWAQFQTGDSATSVDFSDPLWEDKELIAWGMDGDNKWNDYWRRTNPFIAVSNYQYVTCQDVIRGAFAVSSFSGPGYVMNCGDCSLTSSAGCNCYPYYDVAGNYQISPDPVSEPDTPTAPSGWPSAYANPNPPYETFNPGEEIWSVQNCQQYQPFYVYYYTYRLKINRKGKFYKSFGISRAFQPNKKQWDAFCDNAYNAFTSSGVRQCFVPSSKKGSSKDNEQALKGADYQYQSGEWRDNGDIDNRLQFFHTRFEEGCHFKARQHRFPTAAYCGDDSGWRFGGGTTAHVRFGCDTETFQDTTTDGFDIDDSDCGSAYLQFDQLNPLTPTAGTYQYDEGAPTFSYFSASNQGISFVNTPYARYFDDAFDDEDDTNSNIPSACWYESKFTDHRNEIPSYRTECSAGVLAVPVLALFSTLFVFFRNLF